MFKWFLFWYVCVSALVYSLLMYGLVGCSTDPNKNRVADCVIKGCQTPAPSNKCTVSQQNDKSTVTCPDGSSTVITNGKDGTSCTVAQVSTGAVISCSDGTVANIHNGTDGSSCNVSQIIGGALIKCTNGSQAVVYNGQSVNPPVPQSVTQVIDPCGQETTSDEIILKLTDGTLLDTATNKKGQFIVELIPGNYITRDGTNCHFTVNGDMSVSW